MAITIVQDSEPSDGSDSEDGNGDGRGADGSGREGMGRWMDWDQNLSLRSSC